MAAVLAPGDLVALSGGLGSGKTSFARALLRALAGDRALEVQSPTFPLRIDYALPRFPVAHADLYRLGLAEELAEVGLEEALAEGAALVEWPEKLPTDLAENRLDIAFAIEGNGEAPRYLAREAGLRGSRARARCGRFSMHPGGATQHARHWRVTRPIAPMKDRSSPPLRGRDGEGEGADAVSFPLPDPPPQGGREGRAVLMNAPARIEGPPVYDGRSYDAVAHRARDVRAFVAIGNTLREAGIRAPEILAADLDAGLLLLEDLGAEGIVETVRRADHRALRGSDRSSRLHARAEVARRSAAPER